MKTRSIFVLTFLFIALSSTMVHAAGWTDYSGSGYYGYSDMQTGGAWQSSYSAYQSQIYDVGTDYVPSDYYDPTTTYSSGHPGNLRKLGGGTDPGEQSDESPIGEPWIMVVFALLAAGVITRRSRDGYGTMTRR